MSALWKFRVATPDDADALTQLVNSVYRGESGLRAWTGEAHLLGGQRVDRDRILELITTPSSLILIAESQKDLRSMLGCVHVCRTDQVGYLGMLTVHVDFQKSGLGRALLSHAESVAKQELAVQQMTMTVISIRHELIAWYERRGYYATGERRPFPYGDERFGLPLRPDLEFVVLSKQL